MPKRSAQTSALPAPKKQKTKPQPGPGAHQAQSTRDAPLSTSSRQPRSAPPDWRGTARGGSRIRHREYIGDVNGSVAFTASSYAVNPGMSQTFPWLSRIAKQYESYRFHSLCFEFDGGRAATTDGKIALVVDYDAADAIPATKLDMLNYEGASSEKIWQDSKFVCRPTDLHKAASNYVRSAPLAANLDIKTYDVGNFIVATSGQATTAFVGELFVVYDVEFMTPQLSAADVVSFRGSSSSALAAATPFGTNFTNAASSTLNATVNGAGTTMTFNEAFTGLLALSYSGTTMVNQVAGGTATVTLLASVTGTGSSPSTYLYAVTAASGQTFAPSGGTFSAVTGLVLRGAQWNVALA